MKRYKRLWIILVVALLGTGAWASWRVYVRRAKAPVYQSIKVERGNLKMTVQTTGIVQPQNRLEIKSPIAGRVEQVLVKEGDHLQKGQILAWVSSTERAALLDAARAKGEKELAYWEELYKPMPLVAPLEGDLIARNIEPGQTVTAADVLFVMSDRLIVEAQVDETDIGRVAVGQTAEITLDAYPDKRVDAKVDHIAYEAKTVNNVTVYVVDILPDAVPRYMRSGMTANIQVLTSLTNNILLVPSDTIHTESGRTVVYTPGPADQTSRATVTVTTGMSDGKKTEIISGLNEGDMVLTKSIQMSQRKEQAKNPFIPSRPKSSSQKSNSPPPPPP